VSYAFAYTARISHDYHDLMFDVKPKQVTSISHQFHMQEAAWLYHYCLFCHIHWQKYY